MGKRFSVMYLGRRAPEVQPAYRPSYSYNPKWCARPLPLHKRMSELRYEYNRYTRSYQLHLGATVIYDNKNPVL